MAEYRRRTNNHVEVGRTEGTKLTQLRNNINNHEHSQQPSRVRSPSRDRYRRTRDTSRESRSPSFRPVDDDLYRPRRNKERSPPRNSSHYSPDRRAARLRSVSPRRDLPTARHSQDDRDRANRRQRSPKTSPHRRPVPSSEATRDSYRPSPRRRSPDYYVPSSRRSSPPPISSSYRPSELRIRDRLRSPPRSVREAPTSSSRRTSPLPSSERRKSPQHHTLRRSPKPRVREEERDHRNTQPRRSRSPAPQQSQRQLNRTQYPPKSQPTPKSRLPENRATEEDKTRGRPREQEVDMSHYGRGGSRGGRGGHTPYGHSPPAPAPYYPPDQGPHGQPSYGYGDGRGAWPGYPGHAGSPPIYPPASMPYRQNSYPAATQSPYYPPVHMPPQYAASPQYPPSYPPSYPPAAHRSTSAGHQPSPRSEGSSRGNSRRGHYTNLSWTPATGSRGGAHVRGKGKGDKGSGAEEEDDPFRPAKDLRAEDETLQAGETATKDEAQTQDPASKNEGQNDANKIVFGFKKMNRKQVPGNVPMDISTLAKGRKQERRVEQKPVKRIRPRPTLPPEFAESDSVYYRRPGNESVVGSGTYGKVFRAIHVYTGEKVALKKIRMEGERDGFPVTAIREIKLLQSLKNDNIVRLQEVMVEKNDCYMVFEYLSHDLTGLLNHPTFKLERSHKKHLAKQLFEGLDYLHKRGVLHRDIKAANILISNTGQLKIADFGLARFFAKRRQLDYTNRVITIWYRSPELLLGETQYGPAVDIWSAACVLVEIFTRHAIFPGNGGEIDQLDKIYNVLGTPTKTEWPGLVDMAWFELLRPTERKSSTFAQKYKDRVTPAAFELLQVMFAYDPTLRPSAAEVLAHAYFTEEEPQPVQATELANLQGDWHEFESKALRKEKERVEREARKLKEHEEREGKRKNGEGADVENGALDDRRSKKLKLDSAHAEQQVGTRALEQVPSA